MKIDVRQITEGEESIVIRYKDLTPTVSRILSILGDEGGKLWARSDEEKIQIDLTDILYLESVDDKVFACTRDKTLRVDKTLNSFMSDVADGAFFRCSKSMVINVNRVVSLKSLSSNRIDATMEGGEHILISRRYASEFRRLLKGGDLANQTADYTKHCEVYFERSLDIKGFSYLISGNCSGGINGGMLSAWL